MKTESRNAFGFCKPTRPHVISSSYPRHRRDPRFVASPWPLIPNCGESRGYGILQFRLSQCDAVKASVLLDVFFFKICTHEQAIGSWQGRDKINGLQQFEFADYSANVFKIFSMIGDNAQDAAGYQNADGLLEKRCLNQSAFVVAGLGPGIGKIDMQGMERLVRNVGANPPVGIGADHAGVSQTMPSDTIRGEITISSGPFNADEIMVLELRCRGEKKGAFSGTNFQLNGMIIKKNMLPGEHTGIVGQMQQRGFGN